MYLTILLFLILTSIHPLHNQFILLDGLSCSLIIIEYLPFKSGLDFRFQVVFVINFYHAYCIVLLLLPSCSTA